MHTTGSVFDSYRALGINEQHAHSHVQHGSIPNLDLCFTTPNEHGAHGTHSHGDEHVQHDARDKHRKGDSLPQVDRWFARPSEHGARGHRDQHIQHDARDEHHKHDHDNRDDHDSHEAGDECEEDEDDGSAGSASEGKADALASGALDTLKRDQPGGHYKHENDGNRDKSGNHSSSSGEIHIITRAGLRHLLHAGRKGREAARILYNNRDAFVVLKKDQTLPRGWKANATVLFPSYADFEAAVKGNMIPHFVRAVVYDNEHWAQTPRNEKTHAVHYAEAFGKLAHSHGLIYIAAPTRKWFSADARFADIIDVQLQSREVHTGSYERALRHDVKVAHHFNPDIKVVTQISSNRNHLDPDHSGNIKAGIRKTERDIVDTAPYVDGFWGYLYQQNRQSIRAGQTILEDLAEKRKNGAKI